MDVEKLIRRLRNDADAYRNGETLGRAFADQEDVLDNAATALSTLQAELDVMTQRNDENLGMCRIWERRYSELQAENSQLRESRDHWKRLAHELSEGVNGKDAEHERLQAENEKLRAELEQVKAERDAAVSDLETIMAYNSDTCQFCKNGQCYVRGGTKSCLPKWRGQKEE